MPRLDYKKFVTPSAQNHAGTGGLGLLATKWCLLHEAGCSVGPSASNHVIPGSRLVLCTLIIDTADIVTNFLPNGSGLVLFQFSP